MATPINIPRLGVAVTAGELTEWLVADGDHVEVGTPIYTVETDKVETEIEAPVAGTLRLIGEAGQSYAVGTTIAEIN